VFVCACSSIAERAMINASTSATATRMRVVPLSPGIETESWSRSRESSLSIDAQSRSRRSRAEESVAAREMLSVSRFAAAEKSGWGKKLPAGHGLGLAFGFSYGGHIAEAVELSVDAKKKITVHKITVAADIGPVINLSSAENQAQGGAIDGLSTAMGLEIGVEQGRIQQTNFGDYPILRMRSAPPVEAHFIQSDFRPSGLGEPCLPPLAAALGNALFAATGERVRTMPFKRAGYTI